MGLRHVHERHVSSQLLTGLGQLDEASGDARTAVDTWPAATEALDPGEDEAITTEVSTQGGAAAACVGWKHTEDAAAEILALVEDAWATEGIVTEVASLARARASTVAEEAD